MSRIISLERAHVQRKRYANELSQLALGLIEEKRWSWSAGVLLICSDYHCAIAWFIRLRKIMNCRLWLWWDRLWVRRDEFHPSLDTSMILTSGMTHTQVKDYFNDLSRRREIAHRREIEHSMP